MVWLVLRVVLCIVGANLLLVNGITLERGPWCPGQRAVLTCAIPGGVSLQWDYNSMAVAVIRPSTATFPGPDPVLVGGVAFTVSLVSTSPDLVSEIGFVVSSSINGMELLCAGVDAVRAVSRSVTLQEENIIGPPSAVRVSDSLPTSHGIGQSTVTIEWTPPPNGGNDVMYTIGTTPAPLSGAMSVSTSSTNTNITVGHNISYTVTVGVDTCAGVMVDATIVYIVGCPLPPVPVDGSIDTFPATNEGAGIVYHCDPGFQPQGNVPAVCASNGMWTPDPALHQCTVDCGDPVFPSNVTLSTVSNTTEGATVTFQCEEGLTPSHPINITCTRTGRTGQWIPNPNDTQCSEDDPVTTTITDTESTGAGGTEDTGGNMNSISTITGTVLVTSAPSSGVIIPVVVIIVVLIAAAVVVIAIILLVIYRRKKSSSKKIASNNGLKLQEAPIMEYSTLSSRGYEADITKDEYSTVHHDQPKSPHRPPFSSEYSLINSDKITDPAGGHEDGASALVYADIGGPKPKRTAQQNLPTPGDRVVYSAIDTMATAKQHQSQKKDATLDLNMMLIQVREVIPSWYQFGEALGVPDELLKEVQGMKMEDYDKLVEILDFWFRNFTKGTQPTWRDVATAVQNVGFNELSAAIMKVYTTGQLPIAVSDEVPHEAYGTESQPPPPLPPKIEESPSLLPPRPNPRVGSLKNIPPRPPKTNMSQTSAPPRPPKSIAAQEPCPLRPPKPKHE